MTGQGELDYGLGETIDLLRESVRGFVKDEIAPRVAAVAQEDLFFPDLWKEMGGLGLLGLTVPAELGGAGMGCLEHVVVMEEISRASAAVGLAYNAHSNLCVNQLRRHGSETQKCRYLPGLVSGELVGALAMAGVQVGSVGVPMDLSAEKDGSFYHLNGVTTSLIGRPDADVFLVYAAMLPEKEDLKILSFIVEKTAPGLHISNKLDNRSEWGMPTSKLIFNNCRIVKENFLGVADQDARVLLDCLDCLQLVLAGGPLGVMAACLDLLLPEMRHNRKSGRDARQLQSMQGAIADMYTTWCACRSYIYTVARAADWGSAKRAESAGAILFAVERAVKMTLDAVRLLDESKVNASPALHLMRDAKLFEGSAATSESRRMLVARELFSETGRQALNTHSAVEAFFQSRRPREL